MKSTRHQLLFPPVDDSLGAMPSSALHETLLQPILEHMEAGVTVYGLDGRILFFNEAAKRFGMSEPIDLHEHTYGSYSFYHPDGSTPVAFAELPSVRVLRNEQVYNQEIWVQPLGKAVSILVANGKLLSSPTGEPVGALIVTHDITERKWAQQRLEVSEQRYKSLFEHNPNIVCWLDLSGRFLNVNPAFECVTGYTLDDVRNQSYRALLNQEGIRRVLLMSRNAQQGSSDNYDISTFHKDGTQIELNVTVVPIVVTNTVVGYFAIATDITKRKQTEAMIHYLAYHDTLTGLPNRSLFQSRLDAALEQAACEQSQLAVLFLDLDRFKYINDTLGHSTGDGLLAQIARRLQETARPNDTVCRLGGDEFTIILPRMSHTEAKRFAEAVLQRLSMPITVGDQSFVVTISIGISLFPQDGTDAEALVKNADAAMYQAKEHGRNNIQFFQPEMNDAFVKKMTLEAGLRTALENEEFQLYYQPQYDSKHEHIVGLEALIRWQHPVYGIVSPLDFIPLAEETGLIIPIGRWVLQTACQQFVKWQQQQALPPVRLAVNLSMRQLQDKHLVTMVQDILQQTGLHPSYLELEITESIAMHRLDAVIPRLQKLQAMGIQISIDDFGTGYSSLSCLQLLPINSLKIDQSFMRNMSDSSSHLPIVTAIAAMAHSLKLSLVAEGVETKEQLSFLRSLGCLTVQGYFFSKPVPADECEKLLAKSAARSDKRIFPGTGCTSSVE
ncbi:EAL domain-containing protein [Brevibacillus parabrevis]|jgi:PAS domain S-box/diguanylate cyclase (GGDEF) domain|uniref:EAL domain-containing protein n=1 Tax=Brevibacillus parabrevis TaxID=54914 RepID=UPI0024939807|nr:EAL domain-containing protein [Brevibacillus parabrevis]